MKIKTWLLVSFFIVMILPLLAAYFLYASVTSYHNDKKVEEYYEVYTEVQEIKKELDKPALYYPDTSKEVLEQFDSNHINITLYSSDGFILYHSPGSIPTNVIVPKQQLFENLYTLEQGLRTFTYKEPVFIENQIIGLYEITIAREQLLETIVNRLWIATIIFVGLFMAIYATIAIIVHRRINERLNGLMDEMSAFASGNAYIETPTGNDEIGELKRHFYTMRKQIDEAQKVIESEQKEKEYMIATISHDLKTPLTSIKAYAESLDLSKDFSKDDFEAYRGVIIEKADFIKQMLDDLITHTLLQSPDYQLDLVEVDGEEFFEMIVSGYEPLCENHHVKLIANNEVTGTYDVSAKEMIRVADNLMMNAIQHTSENGTVWIVAISDEKILNDFIFPFVKDYDFQFDKYAYLIVQNEGEGIPEEKIPLLFEPLYQVDKARSKKDAHGTGLGLSITKKIIEKHGGTVAAFSKQGQGACFICAIPKRRETV